MENKGLQVEDGNFTRIVNPLMEKLIQIPFKGCELAIALCIIRKTYGYQKTNDSISLSQFQVDTKRSRPTVVTALKNLELLNIVVKTGKPYCTNTYKINKYFNTWGLVKTGKLVKRNNGLVKTGLPKLVKTGLHTKERKKYTKETPNASVGYDKPKFTTMGAEVIKSFESVNPNCKRFYNNPPQRGACDRLIEQYGLERVLKVIAFLPKSNTLSYLPTITTPVQLEEKWVALESGVLKQRSKTISTGKGLA